MNNKMKEKYRKIIRGIMIILAALLLLIALVIPIVNNAIALGVERELKTLPLPADTRCVESISIAAKVSGNGNGMQYYGALLLESELSLEKLQAHYAAYAGDRMNFAIVKPQEGQQLPGVDHPYTFTSVLEEGKAYYGVYGYDYSEKVLQGWLNMDIRGH